MRNKKIILLITILIVFTLVLVACTKDENNSEKVYKVTFDFGFSYKMVHMDVKEGGAISAPAIPVRDGYDFMYWSINNKEVDINKPIIKDTTFVAVWQPLKQITVVVDNKETLIKLHNKESYSLDDFKTITKEGASLVGFYTIENSEMKYLDIEKGINNNIIIYADFMSDNLIIEESIDEESAVVKKYNGTNENIILPNFFNKRKVSIIGKNAFSEKTIKSIKFPRYLKIISKGAFSKTNIDKIIIPRSVEKIETFAFSNCKINELLFEEDSNLALIESKAFCFIEGLKSLSFPRGLKELKAQIVYTCLDLIEVYIPNSVTKLENYIFSASMNIKTIYRQNKDSNLTYLEGMEWNYIMPNKAINVLFVKDNNANVIL